MPVKRRGVIVDVLREKPEHLPRDLLASIAVLHDFE